MLVELGQDRWPIEVLFATLRVVRTKISSPDEFRIRHERPFDSCKRLIHFELCVSLSQLIHELLVSPLIGLLALDRITVSPEVCGGARAFVACASA